MGYFDALTESSFKTAQDGTRLFFPWGIMGSGYRIATEQDYLRLRQQIKAYMIISFVLIIPLVLLVGAAAFAILVPLMGFYLVWMRYVLRDLTRSDEQLSLRESMTSQARRHNPALLRFLQISSIVFVICGAVMLLSASGSQLIALLSILFFGLCTVMLTRMIALRRAVTDQS
jgi:hypothetical protein